MSPPLPSSVMHIKKEGFIFRFHKSHVSLQVINCKTDVLLLCSLCVNDNISFPHHPFWFSYLILHIGLWPNKQQYLCMSLTICVWRLSILCRLALFSQCQRKHQKSGNRGGNSVLVWFEFILLTRRYLNKWCELSNWHLHEVIHCGISQSFSG